MSCTAQTTRTPWTTFIISVTSVSLWNSAVTERSSSCLTETDGKILTSFDTLHSIAPEKENKLAFSFGCPSPEWCSLCFVTALHILYSLLVSSWRWRCGRLVYPGNPEETAGWLFCWSEVTENIVVLQWIKLECVCNVTLYLTVSFLQGSDVGPLRCPDHIVPHPPQLPGWKERRRPAGGRWRWRQWRIWRGI